MPADYFTRAFPEAIRFEETYPYRAVLSGNPSLEPVDPPEGKVRVRLPLDGYRYFTRQALKDLERQKRAHKLVDFNARFGHLAVTGLSRRAFWPAAGADEAGRSQTVLGLDLPAPDDLRELVDDRLTAELVHTYRPPWPAVDPQPAPVHLEVSVFDERTVEDCYGSSLSRDEWLQLEPGLTFEENLTLAFDLKVSLPARLELPESLEPVLKSVQLDWPAATSFANLNLILERPPDYLPPELPEQQALPPPPEHENPLEHARRMDRERRVEAERMQVLERRLARAARHDMPPQGAGRRHEVSYNSFRGQIEWRDVPLEPARPDELALAGPPGSAPHVFQSPSMRLQISDPGEIRAIEQLGFRMVVELPGLLLSGAEMQYFLATGEPLDDPPFHKTSRLQIDGLLFPAQRFARRVLSPVRHLHFEGVLLEDIRIEDIKALLRDLGFRVTGDQRLPGSDSQLLHTLSACRDPGPEGIRLWFLARGNIGETTRKTEIQGGKTFTTIVSSGSMALDVRAELRGDQDKLTGVLNSIQVHLKERFKHVSALE